MVGGDGSVWLRRPYFFLNHEVFSYIIFTLGLIIGFKFDRNVPPEKCLHHRFKWLEFCRTPFVF